MEETITFVGLDVHKKSISVAIAEDGLREEARFLGLVPNTAGALTKLAGKLEKKGRRLRFCYEAGPCGYGVHRHLAALGHECVVVAPSLIPRRPGERVKTDRRDALGLAKLDRAGELTPVWVPDADHEAMRDLVRARRAAVRALRRARQQLCGFLLRHQRIHCAKNWTLTHRRWLATVRFEHPAQQIVLQDHIHAVEDAEARRDALTAQIEALLPQWSMAPVVGALQAMRGVAMIVAVTLAAEVGDLTRFQNPRQLMAYLGLVPSEHSSGESVRRGGITKAGNGHVRRALVEAAQHSNRPFRISSALRARRAHQPPQVIAHADRAMRRQYLVFWRLIRRGKHRNVAVTACARELVGFIWALLHPDAGVRPK